MWTFPIPSFSSDFTLKAVKHKNWFYILFKIYSYDTLVRKINPFYLDLLFLTYETIMEYERIDSSIENGVYHFQPSSQHKNIQNIFYTLFLFHDYHSHVREHKQFRWRENLTATTFYTPSNVRVSKKWAYNSRE